MRGEAARPGKRPIRTLSATEKIEAITRVNEGESKASVARDIGVPESTLRGWCKSEQKIRGVARNSETPDSDRQSPASSPGVSMPGPSNVSSEDESAGPSTSKRARIEPPPPAHDNHNDVQAVPQDYSQPMPIDYMSLLNALVSSGRMENNALLLQQLSLLNSAQSAANFTKSYLNLSGANLASAHLPSTSQTVGLVENGLQYTRTSGGNSSRRSTSHVSSAIAPSQFESVSRPRKSLPPAAEAPSTPVPVSPRKPNENGVLNLQQHNRNTTRDNGSSSSSSSSSSRPIPEDALRLWMQQQQLMGQQVAANGFNPGAHDVNGSWFWQWYKSCAYPAIAGTTPLTASSATASLPHQQNQTMMQSSRKSPSKAKAALDNVLCINNNNNENVRRSLNNSLDEEDPAERASAEEAIQNGEKFFKWLNTCSEPSVTRLHLLQLKYLLDNLKCSREVKVASRKRSRK